jgi:hypothetical protein
MVSVEMRIIGILHIPLKLADVFSDRKLTGTSAFKAIKLKLVLKMIVSDTTRAENAQMLNTRFDIDKCKTYDYLLLSQSKRF